MKYRFTKKTPEEQKERIKKLFKFVQSCPANDLLVRVAWKTPYTRKLKSGEKVTYYRMYRKIGYYKNINEHGFYDSEWDNVYRRLNCKHIIQLFIRDKDTDEHIVSLMAHEWRHYLQYTKPHLRKKFAKKYARVEVDANKYEKKILDKWLKSKQS